MARLLLIDEDPDLVAEQIHLAFPASFHRIDVARSGAEGLTQVSADPPDAIILNARLSTESGVDVYQKIHRVNARIPVIFITTAKGGDAVIEAIKLGAYDYLYQPLDAHQLRRVVGEALEVGMRKRTSTKVAAPLRDSDVDDAIIGSCPAMLDVYKAIGRVADRDVTVLITGESGTGKELIARAIYQHSHRSKGVFLALNCAAIPEHLLESELFGHEKGAFTGAESRHIGKFEQCNGGTIFLDEIGDMPLILQSKILRLMQEQTFERVGGNETIETDVRLIAATHHNLKNESAVGKFRSDLYYRLGVFSIHLPPLRERGNDLAMLVEHFLRQFSRDLASEVYEIAPEALNLLHRYSWPGNIRELESVLKQTVLNSNGTILLPAFLPNLPNENGQRGPATLPGADDAGLEAFRLSLAPDQRDIYVEAHRQLDRFLLTRVLADTGGNQQEAARRLGIARETLRRRLRELGLHVTRRITDDDNDNL